MHLAILLFLSWNIFVAKADWGERTRSRPNHRWNSRFYEHGNEVGGKNVCKVKGFNWGNEDEEEWLWKRSTDKNEPKETGNSVLKKKKSTCIYEKCCLGYRETFRRGRGHLCVKDDKCFASLPQHATAKCRVHRQAEIQTVRGIYKPVNVSNYIADKLPLTDQSFSQAAFLAAANPRTSFYIGLLQAQAVVSEKLRKGLLQAFSSAGENLSYEQYVAAFKQMRKTVEGLNAKFRHFFAASDKSFIAKITSHGYWLSDRYFTQQRLSGANPYLLRRVEGGKKKLPETMALSQFNRDVNPDIRKVVQKRLRIPLEKAVKQGRIFVADFEEMRGWKAIEDFIQIRTNRSILRASAPVAIFSSVPKRKGNRHYNELEILAMQSTYGKEHRLHTPNSGYDWALIKMEFQIVDNVYSQVIEHLYESHYRMEHYCLAFKRSIPRNHPLYRIHEVHCRGIFFINRAADVSLLSPMGAIDTAYTARTSQSAQLAQNRVRKWRYGNGNVVESMKNRGVTDRKMLPYYPARDDGTLIMKLVEEYTQEVVNTIYQCDSDIARDTELQTLVNSLSSKGTPEPDGLKGTIVGMPAKLQTRKELAFFLTTFLGISVRHNSIGLPSLDYTTAVFVMPTKLHEALPGIKVENASDVVYNLPDATTVAAIESVGLNLAALHIDSFLDYKDIMPTVALRRVVEKFYRKLQRIEKVIKRRNAVRRRRGEMPYFYFMPKNMINSINV